MKKSYYIETFRPPHPQQGSRMRVWPARELWVDGLSACMTAVFRVDGAKTKHEALALLVEHLAGSYQAVKRVF